MGRRILEMIPVLNIFVTLGDWADGEKYTVEEDTTSLPPELAKSDQEIDGKWEKHRTTQSKSNAGKGKSKFKVEKTELNTENAETKVQKEKEQEAERDER